MFDIYTVGLELNLTQERYLKRLLDHDWLYMLRDSNRDYIKAKKVQERLEAVAAKRQGNYRVLFDRVARKKQRIPLKGRYHR